MSDEAPKRVQIKIPEQYRSIDETVWKNLEEYLFTGFLAGPANIFDNSFVFKTLNHLELMNIGHLKPPGEQSAESHAVFRASFIAYSLFIVMGRNVIHRRAEHIGKLIDLVMRIPPKFQDEIVKNLNYLNKRAYRLYPLVEAYVHEPRSRYKWLCLKRYSIHSPQATGIPGTDELGMNYCQQTWMAINEALDRREETEIAWSHAKFIGSCFAGKGMISIDEQDRARRNREARDIEEYKMRVLREYVDSSAGVLRHDEKTVSLPDGRQAILDGRYKAETAEELAAELSSALSGEKDWHDRAVARHFQKAREEQEAVAKNSQRLTALPKGFAPQLVAGAHVLNPEDADAYVKRMQALMIHRPAGVSPPPDIPDEDVDRSNLRGSHGQDDH